MMILVQIFNLIIKMKIVYNMMNKCLNNIIKNNKK